MDRGLNGLKDARMNAKCKMGTLKAYSSSLTADSFQPSMSESRIRRIKGLRRETVYPDQMIETHQQIKLPDT